MMVLSALFGSACEPSADPRLPYARRHVATGPPCRPALEEGLLVDAFVASDAQVETRFPGWKAPGSGPSAPRVCWSLRAFPERGIVEVLPWEIEVLAHALGREGAADQEVTMATARVPGDEITILLAKVSPDFVRALAGLDDPLLRELAERYRDALFNDCGSIQREDPRRWCREAVERRPMLRRLRTFRRLARVAQARGAGVWLYYDQ